jgi:hypothetical protein
VAHSHYYSKARFQLRPDIKASVSVQWIKWGNRWSGDHLLTALEGERLTHDDLARADWSDLPIADFVVAHGFKAFTLLPCDGPTPRRSFVEQGGNANCLAITFSSQQLMGQRLGRLVQSYWHQGNLRKTRPRLYP